MDLSGKLRELRNEEGITQKVLAEKLQISRSALALYELGLRQIPHELIPAIAKYFDVTTDYLYGLED